MGALDQASGYRFRYATESELLVGLQCLTYTTEEITKMRSIRVSRPIKKASNV